MCFAVACVSLILSIAIYFGFRNWFKHADINAKQAAAKGASSNLAELTPKQTKDRIVALCLVFAVVIFFWMAFHQNGLTMKTSPSAMRRSLTSALDISTTCAELSP